jgi:hypothetical protein
MTLRPLLLLGLVAAISALVGGAAGYLTAKQHSAQVMNMMRALEFNQRLTSLRLMREHKMPSKTVESLEISAVLVAERLALDAPNDDAAYALRKTAESLVLYLWDFPDSELADRRHTGVTQLAAMAKR